ncbi:MAG: plastocyanin/azurin family copper-binding protein [Ginsengibacter sp.]
MTSISLKASGMQYDKVRFHVRPGARVKITLKNEDDMSHNLVITQPGSRLDIVKAAQNLGEEGSKINFIPSLSKVLWYIPLLSPGQTESITFLAPKVPGIYPYVCTYPGHGFVMFGAMYVSNEAMPALKEDPNIPPSRKNDHDTTDHSAKALQAGHPYPLIPPFLFRTFMPDTGPDAIAVRLPQNLSYCWDAGTCRLRYAWQGEFLDFTDFWKSYKRFSVEITGTIFYRDKTKFPLHLGRSENIPVVEFKGYKLIEKYPEFHYTIKGIDVYELIHSKPDGTGLIRTFRIPEITESIWFTYGRGDGVNYYCSKGHVVNNEIKLSANEAHEFTIIMTKKGGF